MTSPSSLIQFFLICAPAGKSNRAAERFPQRRSESTGEGARPAWGDRLPTPFPGQVHKQVAVLCFLFCLNTPKKGVMGQGSFTENPGTGSDFLTSGLNLHSWSLAPPGPGLSIRVICAEEAFICKDFAETNNMLKIITDFSASVKKVGIKPDR